MGNEKQRDEGPPAEVTGEWAFDFVYPSSEHAAGCGGSGSFFLTQSSGTVTGTAYGSTTCDSTNARTVANGTVSGSHVSFGAGNCAFTGTGSGSPTDYLGGDVTCYTRTYPASAAPRSPGAAGATNAAGTAAATLVGRWHAERPGPLAPIAVTPPVRAMVVGGTVALAVTLRDNLGRTLGRALTWHSDNSAVASVSSSGLVTAVAPGTANISVAASDGGAAVSITVALVGYASLAAGNTHTCGLATGGAAYCWGGNDAGQLGDGWFVSSTSPVRVSSGLTFATLSAAGDRTCGLTTTGAAYCWGAAAYGPPSGVATPALVPGGHAFAAIAAVEDHTCALTSTGEAWCWGYNGLGQLGDGTLTNRDAPVAVSGAPSLSVLASGASHSCGLTASGAAWCWGSNTSGQLGYGLAGGASSTPVAVAGGLAFSALALGREHSCALTTTGAAYCWGSDYNSALGNGPALDSPVPGPVAGGLTFTALATNRYNTCAIATSGQAYCWGSGAYGTQYGAVPTAAGGGFAFTTVSAGSEHACGLATGAVAYCWGGNYSGQLGGGTTSLPVALPVKVLGQP